MAIFCPAVDRKVLYLDCLECENKVCKNQTNEETKKDKKLNNN